MPNFTDKCLFPDALNRAVRVLAGVSGGADSLALLLVLAARKYPVEAVHFEHGIRGAASVADANETASFCKARNIPCHVVPLDVPAHLRPGENLEAAARRRRLEAWRKLAGSGDVVALGHHRNDAEENFLLRFARGGNLSSLTNLRPEKRLGGVVIVRPLLNVTRREIEEFLRSNDVEKWCEDATNADVSYQRNFLRRAVLAEWTARFPATAGGFAASLDNLALDADFIENAADAAAAQISGHASTRRAFWQSLHPALLPRVLDRYFETGASPSLRLLREFKTWLAEDGRGEFKIHGRTWRRNGELLTVEPVAAPCPAELIWHWKTTPEIWTAAGIFRATSAIFSGIAVNAPERAIFDFAALPDELLLSPRRAGEKYRAFDGRSASVKKLMIDAKLPPARRRLLPLLRTVDGTVIWLPGLANCGLFKAVPGNAAAVFQFVPSSVQPVG
ncbi:MAG: tRNA lysidine(34) synthetase TilS [Victivallaceae bacterium]|nr:tRNA lysidine(34) synthetase TilS [Victivallaceae bacterium]